MVDSRHEEKAHQESEAAQGGEETRSLRRGAKEGMGSGEEKEINERLCLWISDFLNAYLQSPISDKRASTILVNQVLSYLRNPQAPLSRPASLFDIEDNM
jgi:hypothetical protein